ncbi:uncharacterized protein CDV56_103801 [Aspergillus thermomutatus]|uniref:Major facilitator superfamily (MFS) profile domain-containing protein n=1 Tax=Aspergillus thermomutatus TaxID=41047 RepID=A0A397GKD5_ASPTH|nr:uncharacterized protein CDV56_103801 [Aspergillus thermomutatus]RHZ50987.1 hypothetical protein CDV56_103801 [Aspergillus thermomutatus]
MYYSSSMFREAGFDTRMALVTSLGCGITNWIFALPAVYTIDTFGRRNLLLTTFPLMCLFLLFTGFSFYIPDQTPRTACVATGIYLFMIVYSPGEGPVPFTYSAEAFPLYIRDIGMSFATATTWGFNFIVSLTWPSLNKSFTPTGAFGWYAAWNFFGWIFCYFCLPETKALSLEELDQVFSVPTTKHINHYCAMLPCSTRPGAARPGPSTDMDTDRVHAEPASDGERDYEKQDSKPEYQDAFGDEEYAEVKYKTLSWWQCGFLMVAETVSLGILSLPAVVAALGLVPAVILLVALGLMSTYTGYTIGQFKWRYPHVHSSADAGEVILGSFGRELFGTGQLLLVVFIMASHILTFTVAMNSITDHGTCSIVFGVVALVISFVLCLPRTLAKVSFLSVASFISVFSAVLIVMIAVGIQRPWHGGVNATVDTSLYEAFLAVCNIVFSFSGHVAFFGFMAELKNPRDYPKSLFLLQGIDTCLYIVASVVIYCYAGDDVTSPALGSASPIVKKVAYGIALPTIIIGGVVNGHVACKYIYVRMWRHSDRMHKRDLVATGSWVLIGLATWIVAWIIAEAIPVFNNLLSLVVGVLAGSFGVKLMMMMQASLFASWFTYGFSALFWLYLNKGRFFSTPMKTALTILNVFIMGIACCICGLGLYVSGKALHDDPSSASFSCANNA